MARLKTFRIKVCTYNLDSWVCGLFPVANPFSVPSCLVCCCQPIYIKVEKILKSSLNLISSPSPSLKIQIMDEKVCLRGEGKTLLGDVNKLLIRTPRNVLLLHLKQTFPPIDWIFNEGEGDEIESKLPFKIFSTLPFRQVMINDRAD